MLRFLTALMVVFCLATPAFAAPLKVVASFSILGDMAKQVGGDLVEVSTLVGPDSDAHMFEPKPSDAKKLASAQVALFNGLGFEGWMERLLKSSGSKAAVVTVSKGIDARKMEDGEDDDHGHAKEKGHKHDHEDEHGHGGIDPHAWQSIPNALIYVATIRDAFIAADAANADHYRKQADAYMVELRTLDAWVRDEVKKIPAANRHLVTNHDAFGYFAHEYGVEFLAAHGLQTEAEPTAKHMASLVSEMKQKRIKAAFIENISNPALIQKLEAETGVKFGGKLYSDALSDKPPVDSYIGMIRWNVTALAQALK